MWAVVLLIVPIGINIPHTHSIHNNTTYSVHNIFISTTNTRYAQHTQHPTHSTSHKGFFLMCIPRLLKHESAPQNPWRTERAGDFSLLCLYGKLKRNLQDTYTLNQMGVLSQFPLHRLDLLEKPVVNVPMVRHRVGSPRTPSIQATTWVRKPRPPPPAQTSILSCFSPSEWLCCFLCEKEVCSHMWS